MKKGFTLIELLAVIVILAIIALIATPIVLNIINDARESSTLRSADFYLDAVEYTIADAVLNKGGMPDDTYQIMPDGNLCRVELASDKTCPKTGDKSNILEVEVNGKKPDGGTITIENGNIKDISINLNDKIVVKNEKGELEFDDDEPKSVCVFANVGTKGEIGSKYECEVKPGTKYNFYVISQESDGTTNLIMERNICEDGTATSPTKTEKCFVNWANEKDNTSGPVVAMDYLYEATSSWTNIPNLVMDYDDEESTSESGYGGIKTINDLTQITRTDGTIVKGYTNLKARLPYKKEISKSNGANEYLYEYLDGSEWGGVSEKRPSNNINEIYGYWTLSSASGFSNYYAFYAYSSGNIVENYTDSYGNDILGVRPVINIKL